MKDDAAAPGLPATGSATSVYAGASETTFDIYDPYGHFFGAPAVEQSVPGHLTAWYFVQPDSRVFSQTQYGLERTASIGGSLEVDVPEPDIVILLGLGLAGVALARISRKRHQRRNGIA
jgi:hypothetical protein